MTEHEKWYQFCMVCKYSCIRKDDTDKVYCSVPKWYCPHKKGIEDAEKMRLIDADVLVYHKIEPDCFVVFKSDIDRQPIIEAMPVKYGKWIKEYWHSEHTRKCSACNITQTVTTYNGKVNFSYCPYCGARMNEERKEE